jgi:hypothetical protein
VRRRPGAMRIADYARSHLVGVRTYGESPDADVRVETLALRGSGSSFTLVARGRRLGRVRLVLPGRHNALNAAAAFTAGSLLGFAESDLRAGLESFTGTRRRFELKGMQSGVRVYDDYAHHPTEIEAILAAAREVAGSGRLVVAFQPHRYSRTAAFHDAFGTALGLADEVVVMEVYSAARTPSPGVSGASVAAAVPLPRSHVIFEPPGRRWRRRSHAAPGPATSSSRSVPVTSPWWGPEVLGALSEQAADRPLRPADRPGLPRDLRSASGRVGRQPALIDAALRRAEPSSPLGGPSAAGRLARGRGRRSRCGVDGPGVVVAGRAPGPHRGCAHRAGGAASRARRCSAWHAVGAGGHRRRPGPGGRRAGGRARAGEAFAAGHARRARHRARAGGCVAGQRPAAVRRRRRSGLRHGDPGSGGSATARGTGRRRAGHAAGGADRGAGAASAVRAQVRSVSASGPESITLRLTGGRTVVWGNEAQSPLKALVLAALLNRKAAVYDVSAPGAPTTRAAEAVDQARRIRGAAAPRRASRTTAPSMLRPRSPGPGAEPAHDTPDTP